MTSILNETIDTAKNAIDSAREGTATAATGGRSKLLDGIHAATALYGAVRTLGLDDAIGWVGLERRRPLRTAVLIGAGIALGVGLGVLFAPMAGAKLRSLLLPPILRKATEAERKAEELQSNVAEASHKAVQSVQHAEQHVAEAAKHGLKATLDAVTPPKPTPEVPGKPENASNHLTDGYGHDSGKHGQRTA